MAPDNTSIVYMEIRKIRILGKNILQSTQVINGMLGGTLVDGAAYGVTHAVS